MKLFKLSFRKKSKPDLGSEELEANKSGPVAAGVKGSGGAKQWLILHLEKLCMVGAVLVFGLLIYSAVGKLSVNPKQNAAELASKAAQMDALIDRSDWDGSADQIPDFVTQVQQATMAIGKDKYSFKSLVGIEAQKVRKRTWPKFLPAEDIWVEGGSGIFWITAPQEETIRDQEAALPPEGNGNSIPLARSDYEGETAPEAATAEIKHWVAITALIPLKKQQSLFERTYQEAEGYQPLEDVPDYLLARIKRIELKGDNPGGENLNWNEPDVQWEWAPQLTKQKVNVTETALGRLNPNEHDRWATEAIELVDPRYVHPRLTTPLGPLGYVGWQQWATHPSVPTLKTSVEKDPEKSKRNFRNQRNNRLQNKQLGSKDAGGPAKKNNGGDRARKFDNFLNPLSDQPSEAISIETEGVSEKSEMPPDSVIGENQLLRLFDFDVQPGKTYVYQVQMLLKNPNYNKPSRILRDPGHRKLPYVPDQKLPWSKQSAPVYIPPLTEVYAAVVPEPAKKEATVIIKAPKGDEGGILIGELTLPQGGVVADGSLQRNRSYKMNGLSRKLAQGADRLDAELLLVDIRSQAPVVGEAGMSELLFLDANGEFLLRNTTSVHDQRETKRFNRLRTAFEQGMQNNKNAQAKRQKNAGGDEDQEDKDLLGGKSRNDK